jgi:hypothetical protein
MVIGDKLRALREEKLFRNVLDSEIRTRDLRFRKIAKSNPVVCFQLFVGGRFGGFKGDIGQLGYSLGYRSWV